MILKKGLLLQRRILKKNQKGNKMFGIGPVLGW